jgi:hypothetical protein
LRIFEYSDTRGRLLAKVDHCLTRRIGVIGRGDTMTDVTDTKLDLPAQVQLSFRDDVNDVDRENAERSVAALIARSAAIVAQNRATEAELAKLTGALNKPLENMIEGDHDAARARETLRARQLMNADTMDALGESPPQELSVRTLGFVPPYDFSWAWHDTNGHAPFSTRLDRPSGRVGVDARSGQVTGGASGFVNAHVGFGVFLRSDTTKKVFPHSGLDPGRWSFAARAIGVGSNAVAEGGFELTVFEDGQYLTGASRRLWRGRVSGTVFDPDESASGRQGPQFFAGPELEFTIRAGHGYTFNAGVWAFSDRSTGAGAAGVQSFIEATIKRMWVFNLP